MFIATLLMMALGLVLWIPYGPGHPDLQIIGRKIFYKPHYVQHQLILLSTSVIMLLENRKSKGIDLAII